MYLRRDSLVGCLAATVTQDRVTPEGHQSSEDEHDCEAHGPHVRTGVGEARRRRRLGCGLVRVGGRRHHDGCRAYFDLLHGLGTRLGDGGGLLLELPG